MTKKRAIIVQPGKLGDIILMSPVAKYYSDKGYEVDYPVFSNFKNYFKNLDYVNCIDFGIFLKNKSYFSNKRVSMFNDNSKMASIFLFDKIYELINNNSYDLVIDPCWAFPGHIVTKQKQDRLNQVIKSGEKKWISLKYEFCNVPYENRRNLKWNRDFEKEEKLLQFIKDHAYKKYGSHDFSIVHSYGDKLAEFDQAHVKNPIYFSYIKGHEIYDWIRVLEESKSIVCIDSCLCHFVEAQDSLREKEKFYIGSEESHWHYFMFNTLKNNWINLSKSNITDE